MRVIPHGRRFTGERGAAALEFGLVALLLITLLLGICEAAYAFYAKGTVAGAAREAARNFALTKNVTSAKDAAVNAGVGIALTASEVSIPADACDGATPNQSVTVTISHTYTGITGFFGTTWTMDAEGTMRCNG